MSLAPARGRLFAFLAAALLLVPAARAQEKLDPRLRGLLRPSAGFRPEGVFADPAATRVKLFVRLAPGATAADLRAAYPSSAFGDPAGDVVAAVMDLSDVARLAGDSRVRAADAARPVELQMEVVRSSIQSGGAWLGVLDATSVDFGTLLGSGVVVGFVDSGIDWRHPDFYTEGSPNRTRILNLWDQTDPGGPAPGGFTTGGTQWTRAQIDDEIDGSPAGVVRSSDTNGHGTHVAGIAAGDGSATDGDEPAGKYAGMAPQADIVMVKSDLTDTGILEGIQYIVQKAAAAGKRAVINLSIGSQYGPHDGTSSLDTGVANIAASTPVVVAMGNEQAGSVHASTTVVSSGSALFTVSTAAATVELDFWVPSGDFYTVQVATAAGGTTVQCLPGNDCAGGSGFTISGNSIDIYNTAGSHPSGDREMLIDIYRSGSLTAGTWRITLTRNGNGGSGRIDGWVTNSGGSFTSLVDSSGTISSPATANNVIAVGSYCSKRTWKANDTATYADTACTAGALGDISYFSNHGPTRDGRQKPDVAAPGQRIAAALSADKSPAEPASTTAFDGKHRLLNGTSMATPVVAGSVARSLQLAPAQTAASVRSTLQSQARTDAKVTAHGAAPNYVFGYGKLHVYGCGDALATSPAAASGLTLGPSSISWTWSALAGASSYDVYYATSPATLIVSTGLPTFLMTGLSANTTTAIRVAGVNPCGAGPGQDSASTSTLSVPLAAAAGSAFVSSVTVTWTPLPAAPRASSSFGYLLQASTSPNFGGTVYSSATPAVGAAGLSITGLTSFTSYYLRAGPLNEPGAPHFISAGLVFTQTLLSAPGAGPFVVSSSADITASWTLGANPAGLEYVAEASTASNFSGTLLSSQTFNLSALFSGLSQNTTYHFRVHPTTGPYVSLGSTATYAAPPAAAAAPFTGVFQTSVSVAWGANGNPSGTGYVAEVAADSLFTVSAQSSATLNTAATFTGLTKNTTWYFRASAVNRNSVASAYLATSASSTLTDPAGAPGTPFAFVGASSAAVNWSALPAAPVQSSCEGYVVQAATSSGFTGTIVEARTAVPTAATLAVVPLLQDSTYFFRVGALNWNSVPVFTVIGSTKTNGAVISSSTYSSGTGLVLDLQPSVPELTAVHVEIPPGTFPSGTGITLNATVVGGLPPPTSNQGTLTPLGSAAGVDISAGGAQPLRPVAVRFTYAPATLPAGTNPKRIVIGRYTGSGWTLLPSTVDTSANTVTAETSHFSLFAPFVASPGTSLDGVQVFPIPWKAGSGDSQFDASGISFTSLPEGAEVRIFTILGEQVASLSANAAGMVLWDGKNTHGVKVGSGTYVVLVSGAGSRRVLRVAVVR